MKVTELAPAKLNLYLKVLRKRSDGYHDIETLFERIDVFDTVTVTSIGNTITIECDNSSVLTGKDSICYKAAELLQKRLSALRRDKGKGVFISIEKRIPVAAGLGGGSSDAASVLKALNKLWGLDLDKKELMDLGASLGADVPFFLSDASFAIGRGIGDEIEPIRGSKLLWQVVICPNIEILSKDIYAAYSKEHSLTLTTGGGVDTILTPVSDICEIAFLKKLLHNDLENVVLSRESIIKDIKDKLRDVGGGNTLVSGSGPSVFGLFSTRKEAVKAKQGCLKEFLHSNEWHAFVTRTF